MKLLDEFREFAIKGNMIDLAVGVVIGGAFGKIVTSLVSDIIMPTVGLLVGGIDFQNLSLTLKDAVGDTPALVLNYGMFIQNVVDFLIIAFSIFVVIRMINKMKREKPAEVEAEAAPVAPTTEELLTNIRDILQNNQKKND